jgi:hypothetical protein
MAVRGEPLPGWALGALVVAVLAAVPIMVLAVMPDRTRSSRGSTPPPQPVYVPSPTSDVDEPAGARMIHGVVTDAGGAPVGGAEVRGGGKSARTTPDGAFGLQSMTLAAFDITVRAPGYLEEQVTVPEGIEGEERDVAVVLTAAPAVTGVVLGPEGEPMSRANVVCTDRPDDEELAAVTDEAGRFELPTRAAGCVAFATHFDFEPSAKRELAAGDGNRLELGAPGSIAGTVVDESGRPLAHFVVAIESFEPAHGPTRGRRGFSRVFDDPSGRFELESLQSGTYVLTASAPQHPPVRSDAIELGSGEAARGVRIVLHRGALLEGRITDAQTRGPVAGAKVVLDSVTMGRGDAIGPATADADGHYQLDGVPQGPFSIRVTAEGYTSRVLAGITARGKASITEDVELTAGAEGGTEFSGIGAQLAVQPQGIIISRVIPGGGAEAAGIEAGDVLVRIDGLDARGLSMPEAVQRLRGPEGTRVRVRVERDGTELEVLIERTTFKR